MLKVNLATSNVARELLRPVIVTVHLTSQLYRIATHYITMSKKERVDITALTKCVPGTDKSIVWFTHNDRNYMIASMLYDIFDIDVGNGNRMISRNIELFKDMTFEFDKDDLTGLDAMMAQWLTTGKGKSNSIMCLSLAGVIQWMSLLDYKRYGNDRKSYLISLKTWVVKTAEEALLKRNDIGKDSIEWKNQRQLCKQTNKMLNATLKDKIVPLHSEGNSRWIYINEAVMINKLVFGRHERGIRDTVPIDRLFVLESSEIADHTLCHVGITEFKERERLLTELKESFELYNPEEKVKKIRGSQTSMLDYL